MAELTIEDDELVLRLSTWERIGAVSGDKRFSRSAIVGVTICSPAMTAVRGLRIMGTGIPGTIALGTRRVSGGLREFVAVHASDPGSVLVDLIGQSYARLVVSAADPAALAARIWPAPV